MVGSSIAQLPGLFIHLGLREVVAVLSVVHLVDEQMAQHGLFFPGTVQPVNGARFPVVFEHHSKVGGRRKAGLSGSLLVGPG